MSRRVNRKVLMEIYKRLYAHFGPRRWWPADTPFEVMVGAILTQNAAWTNAAKAIENLKKEKLLSVRKMGEARHRKLSRLIRPSGFYKEKTKKLKNLIKFLRSICQGRIPALGAYRTKTLREKLLNVKGIGPETADSILLYALGRPVFVVDAYTRRIFSRHKLLSDRATYGQIQKFFMDALGKNTGLFNEYHALIVETGKNYCRKTKPLCKICPLKLVKHEKNMV